MNEKEYLKAELRAVREELARKDIAPNSHPSDFSLTTAPRDMSFPRVSEMSVEQLENHEERLMRDLDDLKNGFDTDIDANKDHISTSE